MYWLWTQNHLVASGDLTNTVTFAIEIGIGVFITLTVYFVSRNQQQESDKILRSMMEINDNLDKQRIAMKQAYQTSLINCLSDIWDNCCLIILNLNWYHLTEDQINGIPTHVADILKMNKKQLELSLNQLNTLALVSSSVLDTTLINSLLELQKNSKDNIIQDGILRASHPWSAIIGWTDRIVVEYFPKSISKFSLKDIDGLIEKVIREEIRNRRSLLPK